MLQYAPEVSRKETGNKHSSQYGQNQNVHRLRIERSFGDYHTMMTTLATRPTKPFYSETEAAEALGVSIDQFRSLVRTHIAQGEEEVNNIGSTTYQPSDLLVLKLL